MTSINLPSLFDVLLSLTFVFFIVSLFVSGIREFISTIFRDKRATLLYNSLWHPLSDPAFAELIYGHPLIQGLVIRRGLGANGGCLIVWCPVLVRCSGETRQHPQRG